jgi:hypothetical protein
VSNPVAAIAVGLWAAPAAAVFGFTLIWWWRAGRCAPDGWTTAQWLTLPAAFWFMAPLVLAYDRFTGRNPTATGAVAPVAAQDRTKPADADSADDDAPRPHWAS